jgi:hypothetical protein
VSDFVDDGLNTVETKVDVTAVPASSTSSQYIRAADINQLATQDTSLRTAIQAGKYHGTRDMTASMPAVAPAGGSVWTSKSNRAVISENAGPYVLIRNVEYINVTDPAYGAKGDGTTDDSAAFALAFAAARFGSGAARSRVVYIPKGDFRLRSTVTVTATCGLVISGEGQWASRLILDPLTPGADGLVINSSTQFELEGFSIMGKQSNPAGKALKFAYNSVVFATQDVALRDVWIGSDDLNEAFDYAIYFGRRLRQ